MSVEKQVAIIYCGVKGLLSSVPADKVKEFEAEYLERMEMKYKNVLNELKAGNLSADTEKVIQELVTELTAKYK